MQWNEVEPGKSYTGQNKVPYKVLFRDEEVIFTKRMDGDGRNDFFRWERSVNGDVRDVEEWHECREQKRIWTVVWCDKDKQTFWEVYCSEKEFETFVDKINDTAGANIIETFINKYEVPGP